MYEIAGAVAHRCGAVLNAVVCTPASVLGFAVGLPFPGFSQFASGQAVFINVKTLPGGPLGAYSLGRTFTHEVRGAVQGLLPTAAGMRPAGTPACHRQCRVHLQPG